MIAAKSFGRRRFFAGISGGALSLIALPAGALKPRQRVLIQRSPLAGFQYHDGEALWPHLLNGDVLSLIREPHNHYDERAVRVEWCGRKLGYVPRYENTAVAQMLDRGERLDARIASLNEGPNPWDRIEVEIRLAA